MTFQNIYLPPFQKEKFLTYFDEIYSAFVKEKKDEIWLSPMTKAPTLLKSPKQRDSIINAIKNFDYTTITERLRKVSWSNSSHPNGVIKPVYESSTFQLTATAV